MKEKFLVTGRQKIGGVIEPSGNKNEVLPVLCACMLCNEIIHLENIPNILDVLTMESILKYLGVNIKKNGSAREIDSKDVENIALPEDLCQDIRASFLLIPPLLYKFQKLEIPIPGGDSIGQRRLDSHFLAMEKMGVQWENKENRYFLQGKKITGTEILLDEASVMATENLIMLAVLADGKTKLMNAACEPHVQSLCTMLNKMGAKIRGIGSNLLVIEGVKSLKGTSHKIKPDHIEIGSFISLAAVLNSELKIKDAFCTDLGLILQNFEKLGISVLREKDDIIVKKNQKMCIRYDDRNFIPKIDDAPWPGFPADLTSIIVITASQCRGNLLVFEKLFESRLFWLDKLISMGAQIVLCDPHRALVSGPTSLKGAVLSSPDIRAGMALLIAALCAEGESEIHNIYQIDRGYEDIENRLNALGTQIKRVNE